MKRLTIILLFFASVLQGQTGAGYWHGSTEPGTITPEPDTLTLTYWDDFILLHIANTGITEDANGVSQWQDRSGNGNHSTQTVNANKPSTDVDGNVVFDGTNDYLDMADPWASVNDSAFTVFIVSTIDAVASGGDDNRVLSYSKSGEMAVLIRYDDYGSDWAIEGNILDGSGTELDSITTVSTGTTSLITLAGSETTSVEARHNGVQKYTYNTDGLWDSTGVDFGEHIGSNRTGSLLFFDGKISFIAIANRKFTPAEIATTESELNSFFTIY